MFTLSGTYPFLLPFFINYSYFLSYLYFFSQFEETLEEINRAEANSSVLSTSTMIEIQTHRVRNSNNKQVEFEVISSLKSYYELSLIFINRTRHETGSSFGIEVETS
ncbi:hypothetical protein Hdeb2414_s0018g00515891 [Helianthus debilis subsp. tardiflorus]